MINTGTARVLVAMRWLVTAGKHVVSDDPEPTAPCQFGREDKFLLA